MELRPFGRTKRPVAVAGQGTIPKASSPRHAEENAGAGNLRLADDEIGRIDRAFPRGAKPRTLPI